MHSQLQVYAEQQRFVCFGCKVKGDVLDFVQLHEHLTSVAEACVWLTGTPPPPPRKNHESRPDRRTETAGGTV
ncbi:MAG: hypothetical protein LC797_16315 [Chloroflexi bacterium]|nr:hypothetical protein [Chloroflexota bacterium]